VIYLNKGNYLGQWQQKRNVFVASIIIPLLILFILIRIWPIINSVILSLFKYNMLTGSKTFVGLNNFKKLFMDREFIKSFKNTMLFVVITVPVNMILGLGVASLLESKKMKLPVLEIIYFLPYMIPIVPASIIWKWIYSPRGLLNALFNLVGFSSVGWLSADWALYSIMVLFVWRMNGYLIIIFLVGLRSVPSEYGEAAMIDGANMWQKFRYVTLPILKPVILYASVMVYVWAFMIFSEVFIMSQGSDVAPGGSVTVLSLDLYKRAFTYLKFDMACTEAVVMLSIILIFTFFNLKMYKKD